MTITKQEILYETQQQNSGVVAAAASVTLLSQIADKQAATQYGSFNYLELINDSSVEMYVDLDGLNTRRRTLFGKSVLVIKLEEGLYFNNVKVTNNDASTSITANQITAIARIGRIVG